MPQRRDVGDHQSTAATEQVYHLAGRQQAKSEAAPFRGQQDVVKDQAVGIHRVEGVGDSLLVVVFVGVVEKRVKIVHLLAVGIAHVEQRLSVFSSECSVNAVGTDFSHASHDVIIASTADD